MKEMTLKEQQNFFLDIMKDVHKFCEENKIRYSLYGGSMIGALRHKGFIPWDDDIDIIMPRKDYDLFCRTYKSNKYILIDAEHDKNCFLAFARVCDMEETYVKTYIPWCSYNTGCWIDVFPADGFPSEQSQQNALYAQCYNLRKKVTRLRIIKSTFHGSMIDHLKLLIKKIITFNGVGVQKDVQKLIKATKSYDFESSPMWASLSCMKRSGKWQLKHHPKETFETCLLFPFEDTNLYVMNGYDSVLTQRYGDYMKLPPDNEQHPLHTFATYFWKNK